ncbi:hypothetical protein BCV69DRAFT_175785 [Microstroma glucosiphilum]|uniref:Topoisomerase I damage affected protein 2 n=1 Tax=Pseudomicrostroma glucosiphilum TaxID=1684307 RepID=A0A316U9T9_9BASI|nr:hypothetical protein BCV69DRAFT_175785 [Pseudomicrostroma glucosiphilum]PWN21608.1 hypothetical protein BCV69DRAFT_175785 [Pseudomicrostroma glucosiphilum]
MASTPTPAHLSSSSSSVDARSAPSSPRPKFDPQPLRKTLKTLLPSRLQAVTWDKADRERMKRLSRGVADAVKGRMLEIAPRGFKYIVQVQLVEDLGQGGRADSSCHWEEGDLVVAETFSNDSIICTVLAYAIRSY